MSPPPRHWFARRATFCGGETPRNIDQFTTCVNPAAGGGDAAGLEVGFCVEIPNGGDEIADSSKRGGGPEAYSSVRGKASAGGGGGIIAVFSDCARLC